VAPTQFLEGNARLPGRLSADRVGGLGVADLPRAGDALRVWWPWLR
jgi:hypothetical protein